MDNMTASNQSREASANCFAWVRSSANCFAWIEENDSNQKMERPTVSLALEEICSLVA